jgi:alkanesulfonate monooxygenase SsuD/methylene tetrahydromethanopterin reductase-like flavin-dependent oxidoreductase (luciferase family)
VDVGLAFPQMTPDLDRDRIHAWCRAVDDGPFSSISAGERIAFDNLDGFTLCTAAAALTDRVRIGFNVVVAPWHAPALLAKELASIDVLSGGRLDVAVGVGGREQDYAALDSPFAGRFQRLDDTVDELRRLWAGGEVVPGAGVGPTPIQPGGPPVLCSGTGPRSLARAARWADGLTGFTLAADPAEAGATFRLAERAWADAGRTTTPRRVTGSFVVLGAGAEDALHAFARRYLDVFGTGVATWLADRMPLCTEDAVRAFLVGLAAEGCDEVVLVPGRSDPDQVHRLAGVVHEARAELTSRFGELSGNE